MCGPNCHRSLAEHPWHDDGPDDERNGIMDDETQVRGGAE